MGNVKTRVNIKRKRHLKMERHVPANGFIKPMILFESEQVFTEHMIRSKI